MGVDFDETAVIGSFTVLSKCAVISETSPKVGEVVEILVTVFSVLLVALDVLRDAVVTEVVSIGLLAVYEVVSMFFAEV